MDSHQCVCWRCWMQANIAVMVLIAIVILSFLSTVVLMHEDKIDDKYVTWLEGFCGGAMTTLALALRPPAGGDNKKDSPPALPPAVIS